MSGPVPGPAPSGQVPGAAAGQPPPGPGTTPGTDEAREAAWEALRGVYDPELYLDVVALGLVYDVRSEDGSLVVEMTMTTPGCPASQSLPELAAQAVQRAVGQSQPVQVRVVWDPPWHPGMMDEAAAQALGFRAR